MLEGFSGKLASAVDLLGQRGTLFSGLRRMRAILSCASTRAMSSRAAKGLVR